mgnify:CR=1 FL=1
MFLIRNLANLLTLTNLAFGCLALIYIFFDHMVIIEGSRTYVTMDKLELACYLVFGAAVIDFFDGFVAKLLKIQSEIGKQLDSLADMVTFGLVPGVIMYQLLANSYSASEGAMKVEIFRFLPGFLITIFAAIRLAKFNIDTRQTNTFLQDRYFWRGSTFSKSVGALCDNRRLLFPDGFQYSDVEFQI